jgi:hypothetical protein
MNEVLKYIDINVKFDIKKYKDLQSDPVIIFINQSIQKKKGLDETQHIIDEEY